MFRTTSGYDKLLDRATSNLRLETDWPAIIQICDLIRQGDVPARYALSSLKKKIFHANPHVAMFGLQVLESVVKNCGSMVHDEVGTKAYMEQVRDLIKSSQHENVRNKTLELLQTWAHAFRNSPKYRAVQDTVNIMKTEGYKFPALKESDAMFVADTAPEWVEGECCHRCRVQFGMVQRKHHCRACGQVFCHQCSSKTSTLPKFGIEKEVRVCEGCYDKFNKAPTSGSSTKHDSDLPAEYLSSSLAQQTQTKPSPAQQTPGRKSDAELREEEEFQLALALSKSEAEEKEKEKLKHTSTLLSHHTRPKQVIPSVDTSSLEGDGELARYLNRSLWEKRQDTNNRDREPSAPVNTIAVGSPTSPPKKTMPSFDINGTEMEDFIAALKSQIEIFVNRMNSNSSRGRSIANDSSVQTLFLNLTSMHSQLLNYTQKTDDRRLYYEGLQDKLAQIRDARAALDALREEHREKLRRQAEEQERIRQIQMAQKLDIMRKKKQEYLEYQRQIALQKVQEQEREWHLRQEQQKQQYLNMSYPYMPQPGYPPPHEHPNLYYPQAPPNQYTPPHHGMSPYYSMPPGLPLGAGGPAPPNNMMMGQPNIPQSPPSQHPAMNATTGYPTPPDPSAGPNPPHIPQGMQPPSGGPGMQQPPPQVMPTGVPPPGQGMPPLHGGVPQGIPPPGQVIPNNMQPPTGHVPQGMPPPGTMPPGVVGPPTGMQPHQQQQPGNMTPQQQQLPPGGVMSQGNLPPYNQQPMPNQQIVMGVPVHVSPTHQIQTTPTPTHYPPQNQQPETAELISFD